ncbi:MAG: heat-inducible transcription repressor HrcA [Melioribacteraceae bacterium]|nr:MAG: heat-inducible transcription repressor HrcA [Melioribacteraceae bacterium]
MFSQELTEREKTILRYVIHQFILTASPVGSRNISKKYEIGLSPATVRNIMADLEDLGFLNHPHTSAGRVPTDKGYRFYVDSLMEPHLLSPQEMSLIDRSILQEMIEREEVLKLTSMLLSNITNLLACVTYPKFDDALLQKIQLVELGGSKILIVLTVKSGVVKTITLEIHQPAETKQLKAIERTLNERLSGLKFSEIRESFKDRLQGTIDENMKPIIRVFLNSVDKIFSDIEGTEKTFITGARNIVRQPEFEDLSHFQSIIELIEDKDVIIHMMDQSAELTTEDVSILIGGEHKDEKLNEYSLVTKTYKLGGTAGKVGIVGPKRMEYSRVVASVVYIAEVLSKQLKNTY